MKSKSTPLLAAIGIIISAVGASAQTYTYDDDGRLSGAAYPTGQVLSYSYDPAGNILAVSTYISGADLDGDKIPDGWEIRYFGNTSTITQALDDVDGDGNSAALEFSFDLNPDGSDDVSKLPSISLNAGQFEVTYVRSKTTPDAFVYSYEFNTDLSGPWAPGTAGVDYEETAVVDREDGSEAVTVRLLAPGTPSRLFMRVAANPGP